LSYFQEVADFFIDKEPLATNGDSASTTTPSTEQAAAEAEAEKERKRKSRWGEQKKSRWSSQSAEEVAGREKKKSRWAAAPAAAPTVPVMTPEAVAAQIAQALPQLSPDAIQVKEGAMCWIRRQRHLLSDYADIYCFISCNYHRRSWCYNYV